MNFCYFFFIVSFFLTNKMFFIKFIYTKNKVKKSKDIKEEDLEAKLDLEYFSEIASDPITRIGEFSFTNITKNIVELINSSC